MNITVNCLIKFISFEQKKFGVCKASVPLLIKTLGQYDTFKLEHCLKGLRYNCDCTNY